MFISTKKTYQISLDEKEKTFLDKLTLTGASIDTVIFIDQLQEGSEEHSLVQKILAAAKLQEQQYAIIDKSIYPNLKLSYFDDINFPNFKHIIGFGVSAAKIGLNTISPKYAAFELGKFSLVLVESVSILIGESRKKGMLWNEMKKIYNLG